MCVLIVHDKKQQIPKKKRKIRSHDASNIIHIVRRDLSISIQDSIFAPAACVNSLEEKIKLGSRLGFCLFNCSWY